jgi:hypothetical protein
LSIKQHNTFSSFIGSLNLNIKKLIILTPEAFLKPCHQIDFTNVCQSEYEGFFYNILLHTSYFNDFKLTFEVQNHILSSGICEILLHIFWACDLYDNPAMT